MRFVLPDGKVAAGRGYADIVRAMNDQKFSPARSIPNYRNKLAERVLDMYGEDVDPTTDRSLVLDLCKVGLLVRTA